MMYMVPLVCGWEHFPDRKGFITGLIVGAYGLGSFVFTLVSTWIVNPQNEKASIQINEDLSYFDFFSVAYRVPLMFRIMLIIWAALWVCSIILVSRPSEDRHTQISLDETTEITDQEPVYNLTHAYACLKSTRFWQYWFMLFLSIIFSGQFSY